MLCIQFLYLILLLGPCASAAHVVALFVEVLFVFEYLITILLSPSLRLISLAASFRHFRFRDMPSEFQCLFTCCFISRRVCLAFLWQRVGSHVHPYRLSVLLCCNFLLLGSLPRFPANVRSKSAQLLTFTLILQVLVVLSVVWLVCGRLSVERLSSLLRHLGLPALSLVLPFLLALLKGLGNVAEGCGRTLISSCVLAEGCVFVLNLSYLLHLIVNIALIAALHCKHRLLLLKQHHLLLHHINLHLYGIWIHCVEHLRLIVTIINRLEGWVLICFANFLDTRSHLLVPILVEKIVSTSRFTSTSCVTLRLSYGLVVEPAIVEA